MKLQAASLNAPTTLTTLQFLHSLIDSNELIATNAKRLIDLGACEAIVNALTLFPQELEIYRYGITSLHNFSIVNPERVFNSGACQVVIKSLKIILKM